VVVEKSYIDNFNTTWSNWESKRRQTSSIYDKDSGTYWGVLFSLQIS